MWPANQAGRFRVSSLIIFTYLNDVKAVITKVFISYDRYVTSVLLVANHEIDNLIVFCVYSAKFPFGRSCNPQNSCNHRGGGGGGRGHQKFYDPLFLLSRNI